MFSAVFTDCCIIELCSLFAVFTDCCILELYSRTLFSAVFTDCCVIELCSLLSSLTAVPVIELCSLLVIVFVSMAKPGHQPQFLSVLSQFHYGARPDLMCVGLPDNRFAIIHCVVERAQNRSVTSSLEAAEQRHDVRQRRDHNCSQSVSTSCSTRCCLL